MRKLKVIQIAADGSKSPIACVPDLVADFARSCQPLEVPNVCLLVDERTGARYCDCHIRGSRIVCLASIDVPLDPDEQPDYRANREIVEDHVAYEQMKEDARKGRSFSNIVAEFTRGFEPDCPLKIIGGQHRFNAIKEAVEAGVDVLHGVKVYFELIPEQRLDVQLISNTNIATSTDLFDRMQETYAGGQLREWCQEVGLLETNEDFADRRQRGEPITVRAARTFAINYYKGRDVDLNKFDSTDTSPIRCKTGMPDADWDATKVAHPDLWDATDLKRAGTEFALLVQAQRSAFAAESNSNPDFAEKALNFAVLSAWAYVAGLLHPNPARLKRHYALRSRSSRDPLNAAALAKGKHKTDPDNYRGLGYRTDAKERGRFVELFYLQAEKGEGITAALIDLAIKKYYAKRATLDVKKAEGKV